MNPVLTHHLFDQRTMAFASCQNVIILAAMPPIEVLLDFRGWVL